MNAFVGVGEEFFTAEIVMAKEFVLNFDEASFVSVYGF